MKRVIRRLVKGAAVFGLMMIAVVAFASTAFATSNPGVFPGGDPATNPIPQNAEPKITKRVRVPEGVNVPGNIYTFEFDPQAIEDKPNEISPAINNLQVVANHNKISINVPANSSLSTIPDSEGYMYSEIESANILDSTTFTHAGIYVYTVKETIPDNNALEGGTMTYSTAQYKMRVYVDNYTNAAGGNSVYVKYVTFNLIKNEGSATSEEKADPVFINTFSKDTSFLINKTVEGTYADKTLDFTYNITLWNAPGANAASYDAEHTYVKPDGSKGNRLVKIIANPTGATAPNESSFTLKHGEQLRFLSIPVGTKYTLTEAASANYKASVTVSDGNAPIGTATAPSKNTSVVIGHSTSLTEADKLKSPIVLTDKSVPANDNKAEWTNTYVDPPTPTGIFLDNLPFILMIVIAISGFTGYIVMKRRSRRV